MDLFNSALGRNITFVRPAHFVINGLSGIPNVKYYYISLFFAYFSSILGNSAVMAFICLDQNLKTPKYIAVFNLAFVDLCCNSTLLPKIIDTFLFNHHYISYNNCFTYCFFSYMCLSMQSLNLVLLSFDRLVAITFPMQYQIVVTHKSMFYMVACFWLFTVFVTLIAIGFLTRLSFCKSLVINSFFCDYAQLYQLACNDNFPNLVLGILLPIIIIWVPLLFVLITYGCISYVLAHIATAQERYKAFKTCTGHLLLVAIFYIPILITFTIGRKIHLNARIMNLSLTSVVPPMLNPIIYVLQTDEIKESVKKMLKKTRRSKIAF